MSRKGSNSYALENVLEFGKVFGGGLLATAFAVLIALLGYASATAKPLPPYLDQGLYGISIGIPSAALLFVVARFTRAWIIVMGLLFITYVMIANTLYDVIATIDSGAGVLFAFSATAAYILFWVVFVYSYLFEARREGDHSDVS
jgi:hypothetical protein